MNKIYLVIQNWSCESSGNIDMVNYKVFSNYEKAKEYFNKIKSEIISYNLGYDYIEDSEDFSCESVEGEYLYYHELVTIEELEVQE